MKDFFDQEIIQIAILETIPKEIRYSFSQTRFHSVKKVVKEMIPIKHQNVAYLHFIQSAPFAVISALTIVISKMLMAHPIAIGFVIQLV